MGLGLGEPIAGHQPRQLLVLIAIDEPHLAAEAFKAGLKQQRNHQDHRWLVAAYRLLGQGCELLVKALAHQGMHQLLEPVAFGRIAKHDVPQGWAIEGAITLEHGPGRFSAWGKGLAGKQIRIQHGQTMVLLQ